MTKIYFASPLFSEMEQRYNEWLASTIEERFTPFYPDFELYLPQRNMAINSKDAYADSRDIAEADTNELVSSDILVAVLDGATIDVGVATEIGVAYQAGMPIVGLYTDSRQSGGTNTKKLNALQDIAESQFSYINLYTVGLIKLNGRVVSTINGLLGELDFLIHEIDEHLNKTKVLNIINRLEPVVYEKKNKAEEVSNENIGKFFKDLNESKPHMEAQWTIAPEGLGKLSIGESLDDLSIGGRNVDIDFGKMVLNMDTIKTNWGEHEHE